MSDTTSRESKGHQLSRAAGEYGAAIGAISDLSSTEDEGVVLQVAALLTGLAGPRAGLITLGGEFQPVGINVVSTAGELPNQSHLNNLLYGPVRFLQDDLHYYSGRVPAHTASEMEVQMRNPTLGRYGEVKALPAEEGQGAAWENVFNNAYDSANATSKSSPWAKCEDVALKKRMKESGSNYGSFGALVPWGRQDYEMLLTNDDARVLRESTVFLDSPTPEQITSFMGEIDRQSPFVLDGDGALLEEAIKKPNSRARRALDAVVHDGLAACDSGSGLGSLRSSGGTLFSILSERKLQQLIGLGGMDRLLSQSLLVDVASRGMEETPVVDTELIEKGYESYRKAVQGVIRLRRLDAMGITPRLEGKVAILFFEAQQRFVAQIHEVEPELAPYAAKFSNLPATMLWTLLHLHPDSSAEGFISVALQLAEASMSNHLRLVKQSFDAGESSLIESRALDMCVKLLGLEPCTFRDLVRTYPAQRKSLHEPALNYLIAAGKVLRLDNNQFRLSDEARMKLQELGCV